MDASLALHGIEALMLEVNTSSVMMTNTTVIRSGTDAIVVDPAWTTAELGRLAESLTGVNVVCGWSTHAHHDHVLWHPGLGDVPRYATPRTARRSLEHQAKLQQAASAHVSWELIPLVGKLDVFNGRTLPWDGPRVEIISHHGHAPGHSALWVAEERVLIAGDLLSDIEIPQFAETGWAAYADALDLLEPYIREASDIIPGHGRRTSVAGDSPIDRLEADRAYMAATRAGAGHTDPRMARGPVWLWDAHNENLQSMR